MSENSEIGKFIVGNRYQLLAVLVRDLFSPAQARLLDQNLNAVAGMEPIGERDVEIPLGIFVQAVLVGINGVALLKVVEIQDIALPDTKFKGAYFLGSNGRTRSKFRDVTR